MIHFDDDKRVILKDDILKGCFYNADILKDKYVKNGDVLDDDEMWYKKDDMILVKYLEKSNGTRLFINKDEYDKYDIGNEVYIENEKYKVYGTGYEIYQHKITGETKKKERIYGLKHTKLFDFYF